MYDSFIVSHEDQQGFDVAMRCWAPNMAYFGLGEELFFINQLLIFINYIFGFVFSYRYTETI